MQMLPEFPPIYLTKMVQQLLDGIDFVLLECQEEIDYLFKQWILDSATEEGISHWERILKINPDTMDSVESRRQRIYFIWNNFVPYTWNVIMDKLDTWCGKGNYSIGIEDDLLGNAIFNLTTHFKLYNEADNLYNKLQEILPANFIINIKNTVKTDSETDLKVVSAAATTIKSRGDL